MTGKATGRQGIHMQGKQSRKARIRTDEYVPVPKPIRADVVRDALSRAVAAVDVQKEFDMPPVWSELRPAFHSLTEDVRRLVLLRFLIEEGRRLDHDETARFHPVAHEGQHSHARAST